MYLSRRLLTHISFPALLARHHSYVTLIATNCTYLGILQQVELAIDLTELKGRTGTQPLLLSKTVVLVLVVELFTFAVLDHGFKKTYCSILSPFSKVS